VKDGDDALLYVFHCSTVPSLHFWKRILLTAKLLRREAICRLISASRSLGDMVSCATRTVLAVGLLSARTTGFVVQSRMSGKRVRDVSMSASERVYVSRGTSNLERLFWLRSALTPNRCRVEAHVPFLQKF
jgi:hypothetical protein